MRPTGQVPNTTPTYLTHCLYRKYLNLVNSTWSRYFGAIFFLSPTAHVQSTLPRASEHPLP